MAPVQGDEGEAAPGRKGSLSELAVTQTQLHQDWWADGELNTRKLEPGQALEQKRGAHLTYILVNPEKASWITFLFLEDI